MCSERTITHMKVLQQLLNTSGLHIWIYGVVIMIIRVCSATSTVYVKNVLELKKALWSGYERLTTQNHISYH